MHVSITIPKVKGVVTALADSVNRGFLLSQASVCRQPTGANGKEDTSTSRTINRHSFENLFFPFYEYRRSLNRPLNTPDTTYDIRHFDVVNFPQPTERLARSSISPQRPNAPEANKYPPPQPIFKQFFLKVAQHGRNDGRRRPLPARGVVLGDAHMHEMVDDGDGPVQRPGPVPDGEPIPAVLQLPRRLP